MDTMTCAEVRQMLVACTDKIIRNEPYLTRLDSAIGDGDHGVGMLNGMQAAKACLQDSENETNVYALYTKMSAAMQQAMGGASGMIFSTLFAGDAASRAPSQTLTPALLAQQMAAGLQAIQDLGHAQCGDKTMVDALSPAVIAMQQNCGGTFEELLTAAAQAAGEGVEKTKQYVAKFGRAKSLGERAIGHQDAGATSTFLILQQMRDFVTGEVTPDPALPQDEAAAPAPAAGDVKWKKKIINDPHAVVAEETEGFLAAFGAQVAAVPGVNGLVKKSIPAGKTALVIGGGAGHEPMFGFFLGENLADAAASGNVFTSPDPVTIEQTAKAAQRGAGVLFVYGNYAGDILNFDKAAKQLEQQGIPTKTVRVWDDVASAPKDRLTDRRGIAGDVFVLKIAGAACASLPLAEACRVAEKARDNTWSIGVGLEGATIPGQKDPIFSLPPDEMEYGLGIHGEPGIRRIKMETADEIVETLLEELLKNSDIHPHDTVCSYVNGLGSTTLMELMIMNRKLAQLLRQKGIKVHDMEVNSLVTTMEMAGASITLLKLDDELKAYYDLPCDSPYYKKSGQAKGGEPVGV